MLIAEKVKENSSKIFSMMIKTIDWTASNIAHEAKLYKERLAEESELILASDKSTFCTQRPRGTTNFEKANRNGNQEQANYGTKSTSPSTKTPQTSVKKKESTRLSLLERFLDTHRVGVNKHSHTQPILPR